MITKLLAALRGIPALGWLALPGAFVFGVPLGWAVRAGQIGMEGETK